MNHSLRNLSLIATALVLAGIALALFFFDPARYHFYPVCPLHQTTGLLCPACGCLRAMHQLLHGNVAAAFHLNALFLVLLPFAGWIAFRELLLRTTGKQLSAIFLKPIFAWLLLAATLAFGILRNCR
jgi:Protein of unknown function (DUF2752)